MILNSVLIFPEWVYKLSGYITLKAKININTDVGIDLPNDRLTEWLSDWDTKAGSWLELLHHCIRLNILDFLIFNFRGLISVTDF